MHFAASGAPAAVKCRAVDPVHTVKIFPVVVRTEEVLNDKLIILISWDVISVLTM
jgi:hypothetical protein